MATPTTPANARPGAPAPTQPGSVSHSPATTTPSWKPNPAFGNFPAAGAADAENAARGQRVIDAVKDRSNVDTTPRHSDAWPLKR